MKLNRKAALSTGAVFVAAGLALGLAAPANADPSTGFGTLSGSGSDTTQDVNNGLAAAVGGGGVLASYNATIPPGKGAFVQTRSGGVEIPRPNGSTEGNKALVAAKTGAVLTNPRGTSTNPVTGLAAPLTNADLQFSRSSSRPGSFNSTGDYAWIPLGIDAVSYAYNDAVSPTVPTDIPIIAGAGQLSLRAIFTAIAPVNLTQGGVTYTVGEATTPGVDIVPFKPQLGSGTLSFWQAEVLGGVAYGAIVKDSFVSGGITKGVQEHDGEVLTVHTNGIVPFSVAQYLAQTRATPLTAAYSVPVADRLHGVTALGNIGGKSPFDAVTPSKLNTLDFPVVRGVFTVVKHSELATNTALSSVFATASGTAYTATRPGNPAINVIEDFGFGSLVVGKSIGGTFLQAGATTHRGSITFP